MLTEAIQKLLNRGLKSSPRARELCAELAGRRVAIDVRGITRVVVESSGAELRIVRDPQGAAEAEISGGPASLLALGGSTPEAVIQRGDVVVHGDAELAQKLRELGRLLRPDLEEDLSKLIGDMPAHQLGRLARSATGWGQRAVRTTLDNVAEYLGHERRDLVPRAEGDQFLKGVDTLREDVDRLEARIDLLARKDRA